VSVAAAPLPLLLVFNPSNQLAVSVADGRCTLPFAGDEAAARLAAVFPQHTPPVEYYSVAHDGADWRVSFAQVPDGPAPANITFRSLAELERDASTLDPLLAAALAAIEPHLIAVPYLHLGENDYIYKFRIERERNRSIYAQDDAARALYQSKLCEAIKALARTNERSASAPAVLDFGAVSYVIPSHFGFCLGVKNAIERAYESLAENPGRRVFMLSELIHNPFVNEDLLRRGLRYLQSDKGVPFTVEGRPAVADGSAPLLWDTLTSADVVIIPAFGATDEDKKRLVRRGIRVAQYDATCMLVEKVWKAARAFGREGFTVVIHGKSEHEETKATFSNTRRYAPSIIIRTLDEARLLGDYIAAPSPAGRAALLERFKGLHTPGFEPERHLDRIAVVNQTTLLMNETAEIIDYFRAVFAAKYGETEGIKHVGGAGKKDTLCYATQVNQDALARALAEPLDAAFVVGGKNSSNTYQLYRVCEQKLGSRAFFIQSEAAIRSRCEIEHYVFPAAGKGKGGHVETHPLWPEGDTTRRRVLITGGASCPDGLVQQVITRINSLFPAERLRPIDDVIADLQK
jgi:4-hydroxy-3-methylbut-2-enyl diphosphate reductase